MKPSVLVTKRIYPEAIDLLKQHCDVDYEATDAGLPVAELLLRLRGKQGVVAHLTDKFTPEVIDALQGIRVIANVAVGFDNINVPAATRKGILVTNTPDVLTDSTADFAFTLLLAAARRLVEGSDYVHSGQWRGWAIDRLVGRDVHHRTLGIFGLGRIGSAVARRGRGFGMRIIYNDLQRVPDAVERELAAEFVSKEQLLRDADFVSLHVPLGDSTRKFIGETELHAMKPTAILVNTSRGPVVDEAALAKALAEHWIAAAGIDVFEREPEVNPQLLQLANATLAPHIASATVDTRREMCLMAARNAIAVLENRRPLNLLNPEARASSAG